MKAASATKKYCTNYDAAVKTIEQGVQAVINLTDTNSEDSRSVLEHRRVILQCIPAHCDVKGNEHSDRFKKQEANMEKEKLSITLKQNKNNNEEQVQSKEDTR